MLSVQLRLRTNQILFMFAIQTMFITLRITAITIIIIHSFQFKVKKYIYYFRANTTIIYIILDWHYRKINRPHWQIVRWFGSIRVSTRHFQAAEFLFMSAKPYEVQDGYPLTAGYRLASYKWIDIDGCMGYGRRLQWRELGFRKWTQVHVCAIHSNVIERFFIDKL